ELPALLFSDRGAEVLDLGHALAHENHHGHLGDATDPGVTDELRVESQQSFGFLWVAAARGLPLKQAAGAIEMPQRIDIGHEVVAVGKWADQLHLQVAARLADADAIVLGQPLQQLDSLPSHSFPAITVVVFEPSLAIGSPLFEQHRSAVLTAEES